MTERKAGSRPSQVTMAGWMAVMGSALLVFTIFDSISRLRTVEMRDSITEFLSSPPGSGMGISVAQTLDLLRGLMFFTGAVAAAATVLAMYVLQRHNTARLCFTVAAGFMLLTAPVSGGVLPVLVAFSAGVLWTRPARDWFAGRAPTAVERSPSPSDKDGPTGQGTSSSSPQLPSGQPLSGQPLSGQPLSGQLPAPGAQWTPTPGQGEAVETPSPRPTHGFGSPDASQAPPYAAPPTAYPYGQAPSQPQPVAYAGYPVRQVDPGKRPVSVMIAAALTWLFAGVTAIAYVLVIAVLVVAKDRLITLLQDDPRVQEANFSTNELLAALWAMSAIVMFWCLAAMVLAYLAVRRQNWARITLIVSAAMSILLGAGALPVSLVHMLAAIAAIALLFAGGANAWFTGGKPSYPQGDEKHPPTNVW